MEKIYEGKTKNVFQNEAGKIVLQFKDDVTGVDGKFDPGANQVGLSIEGVGAKDLQMTAYFFKQLNAAGIPTHFISDQPESQAMTVEPAEVFGKGLEVITRYRAVGSFIRRYDAYVEEGQALDGYVEITIKDDAAGDPLITEDALVLLNIMTREEYQEVVALNRQIADRIKQELAAKGLELYDLKLEFGRRKSDGQIILIDEISGGNMRVYQDGRYIEPLELADFFK
ncbi:MAG: phosphoribosylaminoimidazolesuccinocarboxamide synthase [Aerococcus sp.]|nr:phosphoribosylaminoimidazolesuccinocarboxamide synthase [Aerococcus sp.]